MSVEAPSDIEGLSEYELGSLGKMKKNEAYPTQLGLSDHSAPCKKPKKKKPSPEKRPLEDTKRCISKRICQRSKHANMYEEDQEPDGESSQAATQILDQNENMSEDDDDDDSETNRNKQSLFHWLLRNPIKKLLMFQLFCMDNPEILTAKYPLKEWYDGQYNSDDDDDNNKDDTEEVDGTEEEEVQSNGEEEYYHEQYNDDKDDDFDDNDNDKDETEEVDETEEEDVQSRGEEEYYHEQYNDDEDDFDYEQPRGFLFNKIVNHRHAERRLFFTVRYYNETEDEDHQAEVSFEDLKLTQPLRLAKYIREYVIDWQRRGSVNIWASETLKKYQNCQQEWPNGTPIRKRFGASNRWYAGRVESYNRETGWYMISYEDGDQEELDADEMLGVVCPQK